MVPGDPERQNEGRVRHEGGVRYSRKQWEKMKKLSEESIQMFLFAFPVNLSVKKNLYFNVVASNSVTFAVTMLCNNHKKIECAQNATKMPDL